MQIFLLTLIEFHVFLKFRSKSLFLLISANVVSSCSTNPCQNGGTCTETTKKRMAGGYTCSCLTGFIGTECELKGK
jgi:hypothetical protein